MTPFDLQRAAQAFAAARAAARPLGALPPDAVPRTMDEAYRVQAEIARRCGGYRGWKVGSLTPEARAAAGIDRPTGARLLTPFVHLSPARLSHARFVTPTLECEIAFEMAEDLPPRAEAYTTDEVIAATGAMRLAIEVADSRLPPRPPTPLNVADAGANGAFVVGPAVPSWRSMDRGAIEAVLRIGGREAARGTAAKILGDPLRALVLLANNPPPYGPGLRRGDFVTTGSMTGMTPVAPDDAAVAEFGFLGTVEARFAP
jgi:2-keto-4-pentenoate hydratase